MAGQTDTIVGRSIYAADLTPDDIEKAQTLCGWVHRRRDHGGVIFIDLRDRSGLAQVVFDPSHNKKLHQQAEALRSEHVIGVRGHIRRRPEGMQNPNLPSGEVELLVDHLEVYNRSETLPFTIDEESDTSESTRLKYRYLDLRRPSLQNNFMVRHKTIHWIRQTLNEMAFVDVETPVLTKATPEGARDFLVPSRLHPGNFYALPQSPQLFKQLLMIAGFDRYYQIVKCFRDEDLRADRQPEFTQLDLEMSFASREAVFAVIERVFAVLFKNILDTQPRNTLPRMTYDDALATYGSDKPDRRFDLHIEHLTPIFQQTEFKVFRDVIESGGTIRGFAAPTADQLSRTQLDKLKDVVAPMGVKGVLWIKQDGKKLQSPIAKFLSDKETTALKTKLKLDDNHVGILIAGEKKLTLNALGLLRLHVVELLALKPKDRFDLLWVTDFPLFEKADNGGITSSHHPFTAPKEEDRDRLSSDPLSVYSEAYDLVFNGNEIGSGSLRVHDPQLQREIFKVLKLKDEDINERFGFFIEALKYGTPPHGGIALGIDRIVALFVGATSIRDVIAFPKTQRGACLTSGAPSSPGDGQLDELHLNVIKNQ